MKEEEEEMTIQLPVVGTPSSLLSELYTAVDCTALYCTIVYWAVQCALNFTALYCSALYCTARCTVELRDSRLDLPACQKCHTASYQFTAQPPHLTAPHLLYTVYSVQCRV